MPSYSKKVQVPGKTSQELYDKMSTGIDSFMSKTPVGNYTVERDPGNKKLYIKSSMFSATLICQDSMMELNAQLSLLAAPFKSKLDEGITRWVSKTFNLS